MPMSFSLSFTVPGRLHRAKACWLLVVQIVRFVCAEAGVLTQLRSRIVFSCLQRCVPEV